MEPRIYTYKITFPNQGWWYWGVHKEDKHGEEYNGSSVTHSEKWENFEFEKQILEFFDDWDEATAVEKRLIRPDLNNPLCLNENEGGHLSLHSLSKGGKKGGKRGGKVQGRRNVESGHLDSISTVETRRKGGKIGGRVAVESGQLASVASKAGKIGSKNTNSQKWKCLVTGETLPPGPLTCYQKKRGIDTNLRVRIK